MFVMADDQRRRLIDLLTQSPTPDNIEIEDSLGYSCLVKDIVLITASGVSNTVTTLKIVLGEMLGEKEK